MKFLSVSKDGGPESTVWAYWLFEIKWLCSIVLLRFENGSRPAYHSHAFNSISWLLNGELREHFHWTQGQRGWELHWPSFFPIITRRQTTHMVCSGGRSWVLSFRGPWATHWWEYEGNKMRMMLHGRKHLETELNNDY